MKNKLKKYKPIWVVLILSLIIFIYMICKLDSEIKIAKYDLLMSVLISFVATIIGFLSTSLFFLFGFSTSKIGKKIKKYNRWDEFLSYMCIPIFIGVALIVSIMLILINQPDNVINKYEAILMIILTINFIYFFIFDLRLVLKFNKLNEKENTDN